VDRISPSRDTPALLTSRATLLKIGKLPKVVNCVEFANLHEPCADTFHDFSSRREALLPVGLPLEQGSRVKCVRSQLEDTSELTWRRGWPEAEFLHERGALASDQGFEFLVEGREIWVRLDAVETAW